jgi:hypothetical protein
MKSSKSLKAGLGFLFALWFAIGCKDQITEPEPAPSREEAIPKDAVKVKPEMDVFLPVLHSDKWNPPVPLAGPINTAGAEDSPFMTADGNDFYFFFTPDVKQPAEKQLLDRVTGIWWSKNVQGLWSEPARVILSNDVALDGAAFVLNDVLWFASVRTGNYGEIDFYTAKLKNGKWTAVTNAGKQLNQDYDVGELHIAPDGNTMYCGGPKVKDIHVLQKTTEGWSQPAALPSPVNSNANEDQPFITADGNELWFTGDSRRGYTGPAIFRSIKAAGGWNTPEGIISNFAGEPTLDVQGNIYFVHHFFSKEMKMMEADIYVAYRK